MFNHQLGYTVYQYFNIMDKGLENVKVILLSAHSCIMLYCCLMNSS